ncbi:MAG: membrane lipoprotein lipid attachment site-containing protein [Prevotella sp.]|nr:membrane lipoprotein lipid attachment site-containing protein [Candidatus Prevotella equi]
MKKIILFAFLLSGLVLAGCSNDDNPEPTPTPKPEYNNLRDSIGTAARPTDWNPVSETVLDPTNPDAIIVTQQEIPVPVDMQQDLMAAFVNGECRDVSAPYKEANGKIAFALTVMPRIDEATNFAIELRYYSKHNNRIYIATPFAFAPLTFSHGTPNGEGYKATWH